MRATLTRSGLKSPDITRHHPTSLDTTRHHPTLPDITRHQPTLADNAETVRAAPYWQTSPAEFVLFLVKRFSTR